MPEDTISPTPVKRRRARSAEAKERVRAAIIEAGRVAFSSQEFNKVSLRGIASAAGYSPSVIYSFFADRQDLFLAIRERDLESALAYFVEMLSRHDSPAERLRTLFLVATDYWRNHLDQYEVLYAKPLRRPTPTYADGSMFGRSPVAQRSHDLWRDTVKAYLESLTAAPITAELATECLELAMHGIVSIPPRQLSRVWSRSEDLARETIGSFIVAWQTRAGSPPLASR
jgi:AcrR family transcriptional regulator